MKALHPMSFGLALGVALAVLSVLCWIAVLILPQVTLVHNWLRLFSTAPVASVQTGITATLTSFLAGLLTGWLTGSVHNRLTQNRL